MKSRAFSTTTLSHKTRTYPFSNKVFTHQLPPTFVPNDNRVVTKKTIKNPFTTPSLSSLRKGVGLLPHLHRTLPSPASHSLLSTFFARRGRGRINPGSVLTLTLSQPPYTFSGVLLSIRRKGPDSSILLRNVVRKTGVEMRVALASPTLKAIKVVQRAGGTAMTSGAPKPTNKNKNKNASKALTVVENGNKRTTPIKGATKEWSLGTPGPHPTVRYARRIGVLPKVPRSNMSKKAIPVDEKGTLFAKRARRARLYFLRDYPGKMSAISAGISKRDN
jgi:large subunit ribosomal protein L19